MPIYEFECQKCKSRTEVFQKVSDKSPTKCAKCGGKLEKMISAPAIQFKGSGWYVTDYASKTTKDRRTESEAKETKSDKSDKSDKTKDSSSPKTTTSESSSSSSKSKKD